MLIKIQLKDPDAICDAVGDAVNNTWGHLRHEMTPREFDEMNERQCDEAYDKLKKWVTNGGDCITVEIDTALGTARVVPQ